MSGGFPLKCDFCSVSDSAAAVRSLFAVLVAEYGLFAKVPPAAAFTAVSSVFYLQLDTNNRITKSVPVSSNEVTSGDVLGHFCAYPCIRVESRLMVEGRALDSQLTLFRQEAEERLSINLVFVRPEQLQAPDRGNEFLHGLRELLIDVASCVGSTGFLLDYFLDEDPDIESLDAAVITEHLSRVEPVGKRMWRGRNRPGLLMGIREGLMTLETLRNVWGPTASVFASRGFTGLSLIGSPD